VEAADQQQQRQSKYYYMVEVLWQWKEQQGFSEDGETRN
jgi:hypothetical protein